MSTENVALFAQAIDKNAVLKERVASSDTTVKAWVTIAHEAGYDFSGEEFTSVVEQTLGRKLVTDNAVLEYLAAKDALGEGELSQEMLAKVAGGRRAQVTPL